MCGVGKTDREAGVKLKVALQAKHQTVQDDYFRCFGNLQFPLANHGRPNSADIETAKKCAKKIVNTTN
jgi:hypothetical protein